MNKLTYNELSKVMGVSQAVINMMVDRNKLISFKDINEKGKTKNYIDIDHPINVIWIEGQKEKGKVFDFNRLYEKNPPIKKKVIENKNPEISETIEPNIVTSVKDTNKYRQAEVKYDLEIKRMRAELKLKDIEIQKKEGKLIPVDAVESIFIFAITEMINIYSKDIENLAGIYIKILGGKANQFNKLRKDLLEHLQEVGKEAKEKLLIGLEGAIDEYKEVRGRGEKE